MNIWTNVKAFGFAVVISAVALSGAAAKEKRSKGADSAAAPAAASQPAGAKVDINSASDKDLMAVNGIGAATAKKIVAGRPYSSVADLSRAGINGAQLQKISPMLMASPMRGNAAPAPAPQMRQMPAPTPPPAPSTSSSPRMSGSNSTPAPMPAPANRNQPAANSSVPMGSPGPGMVWVNLETKVYHKQGDRYYGNTKKGRYMAEGDAQKAGYRESKQDEKKK